MAQYFRDGNIFGQFVIDNLLVAKMLYKAWAKYRNARFCGDINE